MKIQIVLLSILITFSYANPIPEGEVTKETAVTTELPTTESELSTTTLAENAELRSAVEETEQVQSRFLLLK